MVASVAEERPDLFAEFGKSDWETLYSSRGGGGALTAGGIVAAAGRINQNRTMRSRAAQLLENGSVRDELIEVIESLWQRVSVTSGDTAGASPLGTSAVTEASEISR
jgi:hypothetical protein